MNITDELREGAENESPHYELYELIAIADHIDAEHARVVHEKVNKAHADGEINAMMQVRSASEDHRRGYQLGRQQAMQEVKQTHVVLPLDADGVPIHVGDKLVLQHKVREKPYEVFSITYDGDDWYFDCDEGHFNALGWEHYRAPTVEDVLREFYVLAVRGKKGSAGDVDDSVLAEYADKLRLAGEDK